MSTCQNCGRKTAGKGQDLVRYSPQDPPALGELLQELLLSACGPFDSVRAYVDLEDVKKFVGEIVSSLKRLKFVEVYVGDDGTPYWGDDPNGFYVRREELEALIEELETNV